MANHDMNNSALASDIVGKCYALTTDVLRLRYRGEKVDTLADPQGHEWPTDVKRLQFNRIKVAGAERKGTKLVITKVVDSFNGEVTRRWDVFAVLQEPGGHSIDVQLPTYRPELGQSWLVEWRSGYTIAQGEKVRLKEKWLTSCDDIVP